MTMDTPCEGRLAPMDFILVAVKIVAKVVQIVLDIKKYKDSSSKKTSNKKNR